jgi:hypothetical protein
MKCMLRCELYVAETETHIRQLGIKLPPVPVLLDGMVANLP